MKEAHQRLEKLERALDRSQASSARDDDLDALRNTLDDLRRELFGNPTKSELRQEQSPTVSDRLYLVTSGTRDSTYGPTPSHEENLEIAERGFEKIRARLNRLLETELPAFEKKLRDAGAPWAGGQPVP